MADELLPMNGIEETAPQPTPDQTDAPAPQNDVPNRDDGGRFAPREPKGQPNQEAARRREAQERDEARAENTRLRAEQEKWTKRFADMEAALKGEQEQPKPDPMTELSGKVDRIAGIFDQQQQEREIQAAWQQVGAHVDRQEAEFRREHPDLDAAVQHYINTKFQVMAADGKPQHIAEAEFQRELQELMIAAAQGGNMPQTIYERAQRLGYTPGQQSAQPQQRQEQHTRPAAPAGGRSLGTGAGAGTAGLTAHSIMNMSEEEFFQLRNAPEGRRSIDRLLGKPAN